MATHNPSYMSGTIDRIVRSDQGALPVAAAEAILALRVDPSDEQRMRLLLARNQEGVLTVDERRELDAYLNLGLLMDLLLAKARRSLKVAGMSEPDAL